MKPKVSVIIPVYNVEQYLRECLDSVVGQTLKDIEIICINDGSTDGSLDILKEYASQDGRIAVIDKANAGYGAAMNDGLDAASGEYVGIVEPDDYILPAMYESLYAVAAKDNLDLVKSDHYEFSGTGDDVQRDYVKLTSDESYYGRVIDPKKEVGVFNLNMVTCSGIYSLDFIRGNGIRYNETPGASYQDNGFWHQTFYFADRVGFLKDAFYCYRQDNSASSTRDRSKVYAGRGEYDFIHSILCKHEDVKRVFIGIHSYRKFHNYLYNYKRIAQKYKREFLEVFSEDFRSFLRCGEIDWKLFSPAERAELRLILRDPGSYYAKDNGIPIVLGVDANYFPYAVVAIESLARNSDPSTMYSVTLLHTDLSSSYIDAAWGLSCGNVCVSTINVASLVRDKSLYSLAHFSKAMYLRLIAPTVFSSKDKILYIDCDVVVKDDVAKLYSIDLGECVIGAVKNICTVERSGYVKNNLGLDPADYFNSGVLLINVREFNSLDIAGKCFALLDQSNSFECPDQDALNIACEGKVLWIDLRWNIAWQLFIIEGQVFVDPSQYYEQFDNLKNPGIVHFTTGVKPWNRPELGMSRLFWEEARRSTSYEAILKRMAGETKGAQARPKSNSNTLPKALGAASEKKPLSRRVLNYYKKHGLRSTIARAARGVSPSKKH